MNEAQIGLDFDTAQPEPAAPVAVEPEVVEPAGPALCATCNESIEGTDIFGSQYGEHRDCFDRFPF